MNTVTREYTEGLIVRPPTGARTVVSSDGTKIAMQEWGDRSQPAIVLIHGFNQAHLIWALQIRSGLMKSFHLVTFDLRGHGDSDKPLDEARYRNPRLWADDVNAVMDAAGIGQAVLSAWSMGARVAYDYLHHYGADRVAGLNIVGNGAAIRPELKNTGSADILPLMRSDDLCDNIEGTTEFLRRCFTVQPNETAFAQLLALNMLIPPPVRRMMMGIPSYGEEFFRSLAIPVLISFGEADRHNSLASAHVAAEIIPNARLSLYPDVGHLPFYETPERFNAELAAFANSVMGGGAVPHV